MPRFFNSRLLVPVLALLAASSIDAAQEQQRYGTVFLRTRVGSFKMLGVAGLPAEGHIEVSFTGTMLINGKPKVTASGGLRKEYVNEAHEQQAYHGKGSLVIDGKFTAIQWFGRDLKCTWKGFGVARLVGEFDKDLKTGEYWYIQNPGDIHDWGTTLTLITNPPRIGDYKPIPQLRPQAKPGKPAR